MALKHSHICTPNWLIHPFVIYTTTSVTLQSHYSQSRLTLGERQGTLWAGRRSNTDRTTICSHIHNGRLGGNQSPRKEPTQAQGVCTNSAKKPQLDIWISHQPLFKIIYITFLIPNQMIYCFLTFIYHFTWAFSQTITYVLMIIFFTIGSTLISVFNINCVLLQQYWSV